MPALLLLHDDLEIADYAGSQLEQAIPGLRVCHVCSCDRAEQAIAVDSFDLVVADLPLSDTDGLSLIRALRRGSPHVRAVLAGESAYAASALESRFGNEIIVLSELYDLESLVSVVRDSLQSTEFCPQRRCPNVVRSSFIQEKPSTIDAHRVRNVLANLLAGLYAFAEELRASATEPDLLRVTIEEYLQSLVSEVERLASMVEQVSDDSSGSAIDDPLERVIDELPSSGVDDP
jgi:DNA-binding NarL/FixJ family response regulator